MEYNHYPVPGQSSWRSLEIRLVKNTVALMRATVFAGASRVLRASRIYQPTLPAAAVSNADTLESLQLLLRGGYVRQVRRC